MLSRFEPLRRLQPGLRQPVLISDADPRAFLFVALVLKAQGGESVNAALVGRDVAVERGQRVRQLGFALQGGGIFPFGVARGGRQQFVALGFHGPQHDVSTGGRQVTQRLAQHLSQVVCRIGHGVGQLV